MKLRKQRVDLLPVEKFSDAQKELSKGRIVNGEVVNIFKAFANHEPVQLKWVPFSTYIAREQTMPHRARELAILRIAWLNQAPYQWVHHIRGGKEAGLSADEIARVKAGPQAEGWTPEERLILEAIDELMNDAVISDKTWEALSKEYSLQQVIDLVFMAGNYNLISWVTNTAGVPLEDYVDTSDIITN